MSNRAHLVVLFSLRAALRDVDLRSGKTLDFAGFLANGYARTCEFLRVCAEATLRLPLGSSMKPSPTTPARLLLPVSVAVVLCVAGCGDDSAPASEGSSSGTDAGSTGDSGSGSSSAVGETSTSSGGGSNVDDSTGTSGEDTSSSSGGVGSTCLEERLLIGDVDGAFGGLYANVTGIIDDEGTTWLSYGEFASIASGYGLRLYRLGDQGFEFIDLPHSRVIESEMLRAAVPTFVVSGWDEDVGVQVWTRNAGAWTVEDLAASGHEVVGDVDEAGNVHVLYTASDESVVHATNASGSWTSLTLPRVTEGLAIAASGASAVAVVRTDVSTNQPTQVARISDEVELEPTSLATHTELGRVHGRSQFLVVDADAAVWLLDAEDDSLEEVRVSPDDLTVSQVSNAEYVGGELRFVWRDFETLEAIRFDGTQAVRDVLREGVEDGAGTVFGDPAAFMWSVGDGAYYDRCD